MPRRALAALVVAVASALAPVRRRALFGGAAAAAAPALAPAPSWAADLAPVAKLKKGFDGIDYLLNNWDKETIKSCPTGQVTLKDECDMDANKVPAVLGLKSTDAPLFKIERSFKAVLLGGDVDDIDRWTAATEAFVQHATSAQEYAYTASFGEYNPSGGKDQVAKYMGYSKNELKLARDALKDILQQAGYKL